MLALKRNVRQRDERQKSVHEVLELGKERRLDEASKERKKG